MSFPGVTPAEGLRKRCAAKSDVSFTSVKAGQGSLYWIIPPSPSLGREKNISRCHLGVKCEKGENVKEKGRKGKEKGRKGKENEEKAS
jgi:hypothetical protein